MRRAPSLLLAIVLAGCGGGSAGSSASSKGGYACDDGRFANDRNGLASGSLGGDQFEDVCGKVTRVLRARRTRSGTHGYFYVHLNTGDDIEIVSNLDAMAEAPNGDPPAWPWVATGDYVYVQGRYYYDSSSRQGIDWTEDDTTSRWSHTGYVAVCDASQANCTLYQ